MQECAQSLAEHRLQYFDYLNSFYKTSPTAEYQKYVANGFNIINGVFNTLKTLMKHGCKLLHYWNNVPIDERQINLTWYRDAIQIEKLGAMDNEMHKFLLKNNISNNDLIKKLKQQFLTVHLK